MILEQIKLQDSQRWYLDEVLHDKLIYRTNYTTDPFATMEFVLKRGTFNKAYVLYKSEDNRSGMELFFQSEIRVGQYLSIADSMSDMFYDFIL
jgi:hypothetical protein